MGSECTCYTVFFSSALNFRWQEKIHLFSCLLSIYPASIIRHILMLEVLLDHIILDLMRTSFELLAKLFSVLFVCFARTEVYREPCNFCNT